MRILIVKLTSLGDILFNLPVVADLRRAYPDARIDWAVDAAFADLPAACADIDTVHAFALRRNRAHPSVAGLGAIVSGLRRLRHARYDIVIDTHGMVKSGVITALSRAGARWGYRREDLAERLLSRVYDHAMVRGREGHAIDRYRAEVAQVIAGSAHAIASAAAPQAMLKPNESAPVRFTPPVFRYRPFAPAPADAAHLIEAALPFVMLFPFASGADKAIPAALSRALIAQAHTRGLRVLIPSGSDAEVAQARDLLSAPDVQMLPRLSISQLMGVMARARAFVGADTGLTHIAASLGLPVAAVFRITDPDSLGPHLWATHARSFRLAPEVSGADQDADKDAHKDADQDSDYGDLASRIADMWPCSTLTSGAGHDSPLREGV